MQKKIVLIIIVALLLGLIQNSCKQENKRKSGVSYRVVNGVNLNFRNAKNLAEDVRDSLNYDDLMITCTSNTKGVQASRQLNIPNLFIKKSYADQIEPQLKGQIESINILSNAKYNDNYLKGDTLNDIIQVLKVYGNYSDHYDEGSSTLRNFTKSYPNTTHEIQMKLTESPDSARTQKFTIHYKVVGENKFTATTQTVTITP